jgi:hypothetical protein
MARTLVLDRETFHMSTDHAPPGRYHLLQYTPVIRIYTVAPLCTLFLC